MSAEQRSARFGQIGTKLSEEGAKVTQWMLEHKLKLNADKTHLLTIGTCHVSLKFIWMEYKLRKEKKNVNFF